MGGPQLLGLYNTMVLPHLQYCLINWGNFVGDGNVGLSREILTLQKSLVRIISASHSISHADPLFFKCGTLKIDDLYKQTVRLFSFKAQRGLLPSGMSTLFNMVSGNHAYNTRASRNNFYFSGQSVRCNSIRYIVPSNWNGLSTNLKEARNISSFKKGSKGEFLSSYSNFSCDMHNCRSCTLGP